MKKTEIESLNADVLANLSVEELEQRLEMQILQMPGACWTCSCDGYNPCPTYNTCPTYNPCPSYNPCPTYVPCPTFGS